MSGRRVAAAVFCVVALAGQLAVGMRASQTSPITGDEPFYLLTTQSLLSGGDLDLRDEYAERAYRPFWHSSVPLWTQMEPTPDGRVLSPHDPGLAVLVLPAYALGGLRGVQRFLVLVWAAAMACGAVLALRLRAPPRAAIVGAVAVGAGTPGVVYASQVYPEGPAALFVGLALLLVTSAARSRRWEPLALAAALSGLGWLGVKYVPLAALLAAAWGWRRRADVGAVASAAALLAVSGGVSVWWHFHTFGGLTPYATNLVYAGEGSAAVIRQHLGWSGRAYRVYGLFLDARFGLLRWLPAALVAPLGVVVAGRRSALPVAVFAVGVGMGAFASITIMGWWFPGRMLVAGFPALVALVAVGATRVPRTAGVLAAWSLLIAAALVWSARTGGVRLAVDPFDLGFPLPWHAAFPDFRHFGTREASLSGAWATALALVVYLLQRRARAVERTRRRAAYHSLLPEDGAG